MGLIYRESGCCCHRKYERAENSPVCLSRIKCEANSSPPFFILFEGWRFLSYQDGSLKSNDLKERVYTVRVRVQCKKGLAKSAKKGCRDYSSAEAHCTLRLFPSSYVFRLFLSCVLRKLAASSISGSLGSIYSRPYQVG